MKSALKGLALVCVMAAVAHAESNKAITPPNSMNEKPAVTRHAKNFRKKGDLKKEAKETKVN